MPLNQLVYAVYRSPSGDYCNAATGGCCGSSIRFYCGALSGGHYALSVCPLRGIFYCVFYNLFFIKYYNLYFK